MGFLLAADGILAEFDLVFGFDFVFDGGAGEEAVEFLECVAVFAEAFVFAVLADHGLDGIDDADDEESEERECHQDGEERVEHCWSLRMVVNGRLLALV